MAASRHFVRPLAAALLAGTFASRAIADLPPAPAPLDDDVPGVEFEPPLSAPPPYAPPAYAPPAYAPAFPPAAMATPPAYCPPHYAAPVRYAAPVEKRCRICDPNASVHAMSRVAPLGASLHSYMGAQIANGDAAQMVLYEYDFHYGEARLNCRGMVRLMQIARDLQRTPFPLVIQPTLVDPALDAARQAAVAAELAILEPTIPSERVLVGFPPARGLDGLDAELIHDRILGLSAGGRPGAGVPAAPSPAAAVPPAR